MRLQPFLSNSLDRGEASVIQTAMNLGLPLAVHCLAVVRVQRIGLQGGWQLVLRQRSGGGAHIKIAGHHGSAQGLSRSDQILRQKRMPEFDTFISPDVDIN